MEIIHRVAQQNKIFAFVQNDNDTCSDTSDNDTNQHFKGITVGNENTWITKYVHKLITGYFWTKAHNMKNASSINHDNVTVHKKS